MEKIDKIQKIQFLEQTLQNLLLQKQAFQVELSETKSALVEMENATDQVFKIIGQLMIKTDKSKINQELLDKEKIIGLRTKTIEKQEISLMNEIDKLREEIIQEKN